MVERGPGSKDLQRNCTQLLSTVTQDMRHRKPKKEASTGGGCLVDIVCIIRHQGMAHTYQAPTMYKASRHQHRHRSSNQRAPDTTRGAGHSVGGSGRCSSRGRSEQLINPCARVEQGPGRRMDRQPLQPPAHGRTPRCGCRPSTQHTHTHTHIMKDSSRHASASTYKTSRPAAGAPARMQGAAAPAAPQALPCQPCTDTPGRNDDCKPINHARPPAAQPYSLLTGTGLYPGAPVMEPPLGNIHRSRHAPASAKGTGLEQRCSLVHPA